MTDPTWLPPKASSSNAVNSVMLLCLEAPAAPPASSEAYDLCHRFTSAQHSRHIDRKLYKMRELRGAGRVTVKYVPTAENTADIFTKILSRQPFEKHRRTLLNLAAMD